MYDMFTCPPWLNEMCPLIDSSYKQETDHTTSLCCLHTICCSIPRLADNPETMQTPTLGINPSQSSTRQPSPNRSRPKGIVVFSGGSAANNLVDVFHNLSNTTCPLSYVIPISDNGGSTSELIRVFGGPGIVFLTELFTSNTDSFKALVTFAVSGLFWSRLSRHPTSSFILSSNRNLFLIILVLQFLFYCPQTLMPSENRPARSSDPRQWRPLLRSQCHQGPVQSPSPKR